MKTSIFHRFTLESLKQNRTRTLVTIIGIALSMALLTAIFEAMYSGLDYMIRNEGASSGTYQGYYAFMTGEEVEELRSMKEVTQVETLQAVGMVYEPDGYIDRNLVLGWNESMGDLIQIEVTEGRMPENDSEILLYSYLGSAYAKEEEFNYGLGDSITLNLSSAADYVEAGGEDWSYAQYNRNSDSYETDEAETKTEERTYTIVGYYRIRNYNISDGWISGLLFTGPGASPVKGDSEADQWAFFTLRHPRQFWQFAEKAGFKRLLVGNSYLLIYYGASRNDSIMKLLGVFVSVLVLLIAVGTISMIYNSFAISVSERTRQFGMLKSIGATKKQIRRTVLEEALLLCAVGIPVGLIIGCVGIGITLRALNGQFAMIRGTSADSTEALKLVLNAGALAISAVICFLITMIAALIPAFRAVMISPMDAIRQSRDLKVREKDVKTSKLRTKLFGFEGMMAAKNFKRNRKRYLTTVISLIVSVTLFISASAFTSYLKSSAGLISNEDMGYDLSAHIYMSTSGDPKGDGEEGEEDGEEGDNVAPIDYNEIIGEVRALSSIESATFTASTHTALRMDSADMTDDWKKFGYAASVNVVLLEDETFRSLAAANHLNVAQFYNPLKPCGIVLNDITMMDYDESGHSRWRTLQLLNEDKLPITISSVIHVVPDGYAIYNTEVRNGVEWYYMYPLDVLEGYYDGMVYDDVRDEFIETVKLDESQMLKLPAEALEVSHDITATAVITERPYYLEAISGLQIVIPYNIGRMMFTEGEAINGINILAVAEDHAKGEEEMQKLFEEKSMDIWVYDRAAEAEQIRALVNVLNVFSYGFIILIALISITNVFNTISTNVMIRKREYAMLRSVGMTEKSIRKMTNYECLIYGWKSLSWGLILSIIIVILMYRGLGNAVDLAFTIPWASFAIAIVSVFAVVFITMLYATNKLKKDNLVETLRRETV